MMVPALVVALIVLLLAGGAPYFGYRAYGAPGFSGALGVVLMALIGLWVFGTYVMPAPT